MVSDDDWVSFAFITLARSWGPKLDTGARTGTPGPMPPSDRKVTLRRRLPLDPEVRRPLVDVLVGLAGLRETRQVALEVGGEHRHAGAVSCSAMSWRSWSSRCPVAPAINPWRLHMAVGIWTTAPGGWRRRASPAQHHRLCPRPVRGRDPCVEIPSAMAPASHDGPARSCPRGGRTGAPGPEGSSAAPRSAPSPRADVAAWDARDTDLIVGTSAGLRHRATLRLRPLPGGPPGPPDGRPLSAVGEGLVGDLQPATDFAEPSRPYKPGLAARRPQAPVGRLVRHGFRRPWPTGLGVGLSGLLPRAPCPSQRPSGDKLRLLTGRAGPELVAAGVHGADE